MIFTTLVAAFPMGVSAAYVSTGSSSYIPEGTTEADLTDDELKEYLEDYVSYSRFETAEEMLNEELSKGYLYCVNTKDGVYSLYVNKYTGFVYYKNNHTGQILTSNPINPGKSKGPELMSQISITYAELSNTSNGGTFYSYTDAALRKQLAVTPIAGGFRVNYTLGDTTARYLAPGYITVERFYDAIIFPLLERYKTLLEESCTDIAPSGYNFSYFDNPDYNALNDKGFINNGVLPGDKSVFNYLTATQKIFVKLERSDPAYKELLGIKSALTELLNRYALKSPLTATANNIDKLYKDYPITKEGVSIYVLQVGSGDESSKNTIRNKVANYIKKYVSDYTFTDMYADEDECLYEDNTAQKPYFRCALEYRFNDDGSLSVSLPANSITFDETVYTLQNVTPLKYFGAGSMTEDGYIFYPDGSGTLVDFEDFYNPKNSYTPNISEKSDIYGIDYAYSEITAGAYREPITMPVFGIVNEVKANASSIAAGSGETVTNGFFAILEEGSALAILGYEMGGSVHKYASAFAEYEPYSSDKYNLSETLGISSLGDYIIVSDSRYLGSYVTRYVMLTDDSMKDLLATNEVSFYESSYVGMATYYRDYLEETGVLESLELVSKDLPLFIEVFGAMNITDRFLTIPYTKSIALTKFSDIKEIYNQLSDCVNYVTGLVEKYEELVKNEEDEAEKLAYQNEVDHYNDLLTKITEITNINFRLTGFTNGGMSSTYPAKVKWQKSCGGKSGFKSLIAEAKKVSENEGYNFGIYPEFDFMYINATSAFDGISNKNNVSKMVDNRYASKKIYSVVDQKYKKAEDNILVISSDVLNKFYSKFLKKYSKFNIETLSVSTLGSDINSNFDKKDPINREQSKDYVVALLERMTNENEKKHYDLMIDTANFYTVKYATHILNLSIDSSHLAQSSRTVPFIGMVLHGYVNYTSSALNYSGDANYDLLRAIENGASLYYILAYRNTEHMKENETLNKYYGVNYQYWFDDILVTYKKLNDAIGDLQDYKITDHDFIITERVISDAEKAANALRLQDEILEILEAQINSAINAKFDELHEGGSANYGKKIKLVVDRAALIAQFAEILNMTADDLDAGEFKTKLDALIAAYQTEYAGAAEESNTVTVSISSIEYDSKYSYITDSFAQDSDYETTNYTVDNGNVVMVTYKKGDKEVKFVLNYNIYAVTVRLDADTEFVLDSYGFKRIG